MKRTIEILISPDGAVSIDALNFKGADCEQATKFLETALGVMAGKRHKPEYHQSNSRKHQQRLGT
jgi:hypothetical protein